MLEDVKYLADEAVRVGFIATQSETLLINISMITIIEVTDRAIFFSDHSGGTISENILHNPKAAISIINHLKRNGYQIKGIIRPVNQYEPNSEEGQLLFDESKALGLTVFMMKVAEVYDAGAGENPHFEPMYRNSIVDSFFQLPYKPLPALDLNAERPKRLDGLKTPISILIKNLFQRKIPCLLGTVDAYGIPNISPRILLDTQDQFLLWGDKSLSKTAQNMTRPCPVTLFACDWEAGFGYECIGWTEFRFLGDIMLTVTTYWKQLGLKDPTQAVLFHPEEINEFRDFKRTEVWRGAPRSEWLQWIGEVKVEPAPSRSTSFISKSPSPFSDDPETMNTIVTKLQESLAAESIPQLKPQPPAQSTPSTDVVIRSEFKSGDIGQMIFLHGAIYAREHGFNRLFETHTAIKLGQFFQNFSAQRDRVFIAEHSNKIVGTLVISGQLPWGTELKWFIVHPSMRSKGIGRSLIEMAVHVAKEFNLPFVYLWVISEQTDAIRLYESFSFVKTDERKHNDFGKVVTEFRYDLRFQ